MVASSSPKAGAANATHARKTRDRMGSRGATPGPAHRLRARALRGRSSTGHCVRVFDAAMPVRAGSPHAPPSLMARAEQRAGSRVRCGSAAAYVTYHRHTHTALVADLSHTGMQLRGSNLPEPGTWVSLIFVAPPHELGATAHVVWKDPRRGAA